jgi:hypothetical protein
MVGRSRRNKGNGVLGKIGLFVMGAVAGAGLYHVIDSYAFDSEQPTGAPTAQTAQELVVDTSDSEMVYGLFKAGADMNYSGLQEAMANDYNTGREDAQAVVGLCKDVVGMEKDYIRSVFAKMPVLEGSANPDDLSLEMKVIGGSRVAIVSHDMSGAQYMVTQTEILDMAKLGLHPMPTESIPAQSVDMNSAKNLAEKNAGQQYNNPLENMAKNVKEVMPSFMESLTQYQ